MTYKVPFYGLLFSDDLWGDFGGPEGFEIDESTVQQPMNKTGFQNNGKRSCQDCASMRSDRQESWLGSLKENYNPQPRVV